MHDDFVFMEYFLEKGGKLVVEFLFVEIVTGDAQTLQAKLRTAMITLQKKSYKVKDVKYFIQDWCLWAAFIHYTEDMYIDDPLAEKEYNDQDRSGDEQMGPMAVTENYQEVREARTKSQAPDNALFPPDVPSGGTCV